MDKNVKSLMETSERITASFGNLKFVTVISLMTAVLAVGFALVYTMSKVSQMQQNVIVLDQNGAAYSASQQNAGLTREMEVRDQVTKMHELFFNVSPNQEVVMKNLERVMEFCDMSVLDYYNDIKEKGFYNRLYQTNSTQQVLVDSIRVDMSRRPYRAVTYCTRWILRESSMTRYNVVTTCELMDVNRTDKDLHGLKIEKFMVREDREEKTLKR